MAAFDKLAMISLYRNILKLHRRVLPQEMQALGDSYTRSEFKAHKNAKIGQVKEFVRQWKEYMYTLEIQAKQGKVGRELDQSKIESLNEEQRGKLAELKEEAYKAGGGQ